MSKFGKNIKKIRNVRGLTQAQLADMLEVSRGVISSYEEGRAEPKIETILKTAEVFHLSTDILLSSNVTVNQLSGFSLPAIVHEKGNPLASSISTGIKAGIFPDDVTLILSKEVRPNTYIKDGDVIFGVPAPIEDGKIFLVESEGLYTMGRASDVSSNSISLDHNTVSTKDSKGILEVIGIYTPLKSKTPLEERLLSLEHKIKLLEDRLKS
ncbi:MAG TPA: helix-turn-helix transcriptional regulator [Anditalea sp.]|nr:helix-turn-helix transcriptional regulator [Anditalea sp.]